MSEQEYDANAGPCATGLSESPDKAEGCTPVHVAEVILNQLGGCRFQAMTGSECFMPDGNTLRMKLTRNRARANRLFITLENNDLYTMRFFRYSPGHINCKKLEWVNEKTTEISVYRDVYAEDLCRIFTRVTGLNTEL